MPSIAETPVSMNSSGYSREYGLIAAPTISCRSSGTISGPSSIGRRSVEHPPEKVLGDGHLHRLAQEADGRVLVDPGGALEHLDGHDALRGFEHLAAQRLALCRLDLDDLVVADRLVDLGVHQGAADLGDGLIFFHDQ
jgi:hypothetical protein